MKKSLSILLLTAGLSALIGNFSAAHATTYVGNGNNGFGGAVGSGSLSVTNNGTGGFLLSFTLGNSATTFNGSANDLVIYLDNGKGGGIGTSTANLTDTGDNSRIPVSEYNGTNRSTLSFGALMSPQIGIDLSSGQANIFALANNTANFGFGYNGGSALGSTTAGITYSLSGSTYSLTLPATAVGLTAFSGATLKFLAINVSNTAFSSNEATVALTGASGYANTETISAVNSFTAAVPEPATWAMLTVGGLGGLVMIRRRQSAAR